MAPTEVEQQRVRRFFSNSGDLDVDVLRPLAHIRANWELIWDAENCGYAAEEDSFAELLNALVDDLATSSPPRRYHDNEDRLAEYVVSHLNWPIRKAGLRWVGADYGVILQHGGFHDIDESDLVLAAAGRIRAALDRGQLHFDDMEESHRRMLATVLAVVLYHRGSLEP